MRRLILVATLAFGMSTYLQAGFQLGAGALFGGKTKISISGASSATGSASNQDFEANNDVGFVVGGSYLYDFSEKFSGLVGLAYTSQKTSDKFNMAKDEGITWVATDNNTATTKTLDFKLGVQFKVVKDLNLSVALAFPFWAELQGDGSLDNVTGADVYKLKGSLGVDLSLAYMFTKNFSANLGYSFVNTSDSDNTGPNNKEISVSSSVGRVVFGVGYIF